VTGLGEIAGDALINHCDIDFISFTGSPEVGTLVQTAAAKNHIDCTLELGGKSPQIVFADADLEEALPVLANAIVQNGGQTCSAGSRILVEASFYDTLIARLIPIFQALEAGPHDGTHNLGALISERQKKRVQGFLDRANWRKTRFSARCFQFCPSRTKPTQSASPMQRITGSWRGSGLKTGDGRCAWQKQ